ncbi:hypothetical protein C8F04DRAFT_601439 [Mycena alexandri]|uniref:MYND-type domain-containing protein n=1 Tax=Mycena alexandri TaxID=1745969 RepID=A0AAD6SV88_9AGAR|nr:hypothetical protein C8F04DRAFT_601439 [Mycena alexandri]
MMHPALTFPRPTKEDALKQPAKWNSDWESTTKKFQHVPPSKFFEAEATLLKMRVAADMDTAFIRHQSLLGNLCGLQLMITEEALTYFARNDLEAKWMQASSAVRGKHALIGLSNACSIAKDLHDVRLYCGRELTLSHLQEDGKIVLDLVQAVMALNDAGICEMPETPKDIADAAWDSFAQVQRGSTASESEKLAVANILALRTKLICHVVHFTVRSFLGLELPEVKLEAQKYHKDQFPEATMEQFVGRAAAKAAAKEDKAAWKETHGKRPEHCSYTGCFKINTGAGKFSRCKRCWDDMKREVLYCSGACQTADWKPNHKAICGKPLSFETASTRKYTPSENFAPVIGPPIGSYKRSPSLVYQTNLLSRNPKADYVISDSLKEPVFMDFPDPETQSLFRKCREKAMTTGDRENVAIMGHFLCWMTLQTRQVQPPASDGATVNVIVAQLKKEYRFDDLHLAINEMQQRQNMDPFKRPVLLSSMSPPNWVRFCSGMNGYQQVVLT